MKGPFRLAVDIGGTFTDAVLVDERSGEMHIDKVLTTPNDPSEAFLGITDRLRRRVGVEPDDLPAIIHATTVATNALIERRGAPTALLVTAGFRDILEIARQVRYELYNLQTEKPPPLVPRQWCLEIVERMDYRGGVLEALDEETVIAAAMQIRALGLKSVAVCFLHSYVNGEHERRAGDIVQEHCPNALVSLSCDVAPEIREYWRASTTVTNAYIRPIVQRYLGSVERKLEAQELAERLRVMQSSGGVMSAAAAEERPIFMLESGPAAGVAAAAFVAGLAGHGEAISFDMGGTTAKVGLIRGGRPSVRTEFEAGSVAGTGVGLARGSGYPILAPVMDLIEIGAGGGSLASIDRGGLLRVGPRSAGVDPGPACYGRGGTEPTVTDANVVLGRLDPDRFLGGAMRLDADAAHQAVEKHCARPLGIDTVEAAMGIVDIADAAMVQAMRLVSVQRGYDPRDFALVSFGGAGPAHANQLARELGIPTVVVPPSPGVSSALGMLATDLRQDYRITRLQRLSSADPGAIEAQFREFEGRAVVELGAEGFPFERIRFARYLEMRYVGQSWRLPVDVMGGAFTRADFLNLEEQFARRHEEQYGYAVEGEPVEIVNIGLSAFGVIPPLTLKAVALAPSAVASARRRVYFRETGGFLDALVWDRAELRAGQIVRGPAIVAEMDSTTVIHPGYAARVGQYGILLIEPAA